MNNKNKNNNNNNNMNKMANFSFSQMLILLPFHLVLISGPILLAKNHQKVVFSLWMLPGF